MNLKRFGFFARLVPGLVLIFVMAFGTMVHTPASLAEPAKAPEAPTLMQFTSGGHVLGFEPGGMYAATGSHALRVDFVDANAVTPLSADSDLQGFGNSEGLANAAPPLSTVTYPNLWDGVTLTYDASGIVRSTYRLGPYADPGAIHLRYNRPTLVQIDGSLLIEFETGALTETAPIAWQEINGQRMPVDVSFKALSETEIGFALGAYNPTLPLFIDPTLIWNTFMGSSNADIGQGIAVDSSGKVYVTGQSNGSWGAPVNPYAGGGDAFVARLDANGALEWNTFMGSSQGDVGNGIAVDSSGKVYVTGSSFASWGTPINPNSGLDAFAARLDANGALEWNTFMGSSNTDVGNGIAVDSSGKVYVTGQSYASWGTPVNPNLGFDAFAARLDANGALEWNTFMGSSQGDSGNGIAVDSSGKVYVAGYSFVSWGTPVNPHAGLGNPDAFAARLDANGVLEWNTFMGSGHVDYGQGIAVDSSGKVYVAGYSFASWGAPVNPHAGAGSTDAFAARLLANGALEWNTFMGGSSQGDVGNGIAVDSSGKVYVIGYSFNGWGTPVNPHAGGGTDAFTAGLDANGALEWNTFMGSSSDDFGFGITVDSSGKVYVTGQSNASWGTPANPHAGGGDAFAATVVLSPQDGTALVINDIQDLIDTGLISSGNGNALISKLDSAIQALDAGNTISGVNKLNGFINQVNALINSGALTLAEGQALIDTAQAIIDSIE